MNLGSTFSILYKRYSIDIVDAILITGCCGFIGYHLTKKIHEIYNDYIIVGIDNMNNYYDVSIKENRLNELQELHRFIFYKIDISSNDRLKNVFENHDIKLVINLAAQAGVRYSIVNPKVYIQSNIIGFYNILENCRKYNISNLVYASSSSVYGITNGIDKEELDMNNNPASLYGATKICNEILAAAYSNMYKIQTTGLRFFTVYGPNGRPDMAYWKFTERALNDKYIEVYGEGKLKRDFTYIDDIVNGIIKACQKWTPYGTYYRIFNLGGGNPVTINDFVKTIEEILGFSIPKVYKETPLGDVNYTYANIDKADRELHWEPKTDLKTGLTKFIEWYKETYK